MNNDCGKAPDKDNTAMAREATPNKALAVLPQAEPKKITEKRFRNKLKHAVKSAGKETIEKAFLLYYTMRDPTTPTWCKSVIAGALAYFISFIDGIPDLTPILGYTDDLTVMIAAISVIATHITEENKVKAKEKAEKLFS
jgi:uncharacterized membrane protein YkvA (DUF1232 family)